MRKLALVIAGLLLYVVQGYASVKLIFGDGAPANRIRIIFVSEGYTSSQIARFDADARRTYGQFINETFYSVFNAAINAYEVDTVSQDSGADPTPSNNTVNTAFDASFGNSGIDRLLCVNDAKVSSFLLKKIPNYDPNYDITLVVVNSSTYGGSGGQIACTSVNSSAPQIAVHETGHSFANLADEYTDAYPGWTQAEYPNSTHFTTRAQIPWAAWIAQSVPLPTPDVTAYADSVGLFEGCQYMTTGWYRPQHTCKMQTLGIPFCKVCTEAHAVSAWDQLSAIDSVSPATADTVRLPGQGTLSVKPLPLSPLPAISWYVNGTKVSSTTGVLDLSTAGLKAGANTVKAIVSDRSGLMHEPSHLNLGVDTAAWIVKSPLTSVVSIDAAFRNGLELIALGRSHLSVTAPAAVFCEIQVFSPQGRCEAAVKGVALGAGTSIVSLPHELPAGCHIALLSLPLSQPTRKLLLVR